MHARNALVLIVMAGFACGCATSAQLRPAADATVLPGQGATATAAGVRVIVHTEGWSGRAARERAVTPLRLTVENESDRPLRIQYREFALTGPDGAVFAAVPPFPIVAVPLIPLSVLTGSPASRPGFAATNFDIAPFYAPLFPRYPIADPVGYQPRYYDYYKYWYRTDPPTLEMLALAMPEGVLHPGGKAHGYLYFERVNPDLRWVALRMELVHPRGAGFGVVSIPLRVGG